MAEETEQSNPLRKTYGKALKRNGDVDLPGVILSDITITPQYETTTVDQGGIPVSGTRTLKSVELSATATMLEGKDVSTIEPEIESFVAERVPEENVAPAGGSVIVELGEISIIPGEAQTVSVKATYYPGMPSGA